MIANNEVAEIYRNFKYWIYGWHLLDWCQLLV